MSCPYPPRLSRCGPSARPCSASESSPWRSPASTQCEDRARPAAALEDHSRPGAGPRRGQLLVHWRRPPRRALSRSLLVPAAAVAVMALSAIVRARTIDVRWVWLARLGDVVGKAFPARPNHSHADATWSGVERVLRTPLVDTTARSAHAESQSDRAVTAAEACGVAGVGAPDVRSPAASMLGGMAALKPPSDLAPTQRA